MSRKHSQSFSCSIDADDSISCLTIVIQGIIDQDSVISVMNQVAEKLDSKFYHHRLYDLTKAELDLNLDFHDTLLFKSREKLALPKRKHRVAFVSDEPLTKDLLKIFCYQSFSFRFSDMEVFDSREKALAWLLNVD